ncbi:hypothetical protein BKP35_11700 [Anaerobacillus arseniciselenatis]|uniref:4Fe-4S ferredoxin-type domain-containing protein n=1 Tax=Anaerobacillus arseniciselenatis TaxID=85682 RepID=A0A1S2LH99_9BACI|nr:4Fe-4S binding protein [Anaerobacillus arseniciselenatis]OIJ11600.1 hypothetical protein BKP35_11700 [Anaerobacillus arseniciselenatis]
MWKKILGSLNKDFIKINNDRCLHTNNKNSLCSKCEDICPQPALKVDAKKLLYNINDCSGCKLCVHVCPTEAIQSEIEDLEKYEQQIYERETVYFACREQGSKDSDIVLPCVLSLTPEMLMISAIHNKKVFIVWNEKLCLSCHSNWTQNRCLEWIDDWNNYQMSDEKVEIIFTKNSKLSLKPKLPKTEMLFPKNKVAKRLLNDRSGGRDTLASNLNRWPLTKRRMYLLAYFKKINKEGEVPQSISEKVGLVNIRVTDNCQLCFKCTKVCPTGAVFHQLENESNSLMFNPSLCIDCDICEHSCIEIEKEPIEFEDIDTVSVLNKSN